MKRETVMVLGDRKITVGEMRWKAWKKLRSQVLDSLTTEIAALVSDGGSLDSQAVATLIPKLREAFDELNEDFVKGCISADDAAVLDDENLTLPELGELYGAALKVNPLEVLLNVEKNSPAGSIAQSLGLTDLMKATAPNAGGLGSKDDLYDPASASAN